MTFKSVGQVQILKLPSEPSVPSTSKGGHSVSVFPANELVRGHFGDRCAGLIAAVSAAYATLLVVTTVEESELPKIEPLTVYHDATAGGEQLLSCCWVQSTDGKVLYLVLGSGRGHIRLQSILPPPSASKEMSMIWYGHGDGINELRAHPLDPTRFVSASADHSVRTWSVSAGGCTAVLGGPRGHRDQVLSVDWHPNGDQLVTAGIDGRIFIWQLPLVFATGHPCWFISEQRGGGGGEEEDILELAPSPKPILITNPVWASSPMLRLHSGPIGSVRWLDRTRIVSKSVDSDLVLWSPLLSESKSAGHVGEAVAYDGHEEDQGIQRRHRIYQRYSYPNGHLLSIGSLEVIKSSVQEVGHSLTCGLLWGNDQGDLLFSRLKRGLPSKRDSSMISSPRARPRSDVRPWSVQSVASLQVTPSTFIHLSVDQGEECRLRCWIIAM